MRDPIILLVHLIATLARLMGPGGLRSVVAESVLVKQQLLILNRSRHRAPNLCASDRILAGVCALFMRPARVIRSAIVLRPSTILEFHRALRTRKYRWLFSPKRRRTGPQGPSVNGHSNFPHLRSSKIPCPSRIPNSLAECRAKATLRAADRVPYAVACMEAVVLTLLAHRLDQYCGQIVAFANANRTLTAFHQRRRQDVESGQRPTVQQSLERLS